MLEYSKSFASHSRSIHWSSKNTIQPKDVPLYYYKKFWFKCDKCPHEFETNINSVARLNTWCPFCANKKLCEEDCDICFKKSFASHKKADRWSSRNRLSARSVHLNCNKKFWFNCIECNKDFEAQPNNISQGKWCKVCGYKSSAETQSMKLDEFLTRSKEIHGNKYDYSKVTMNGGKNEVNIICSIHGEFLQTPFNHLQGNGCKECGIIQSADNRRHTLEKFIELANEKHSKKYDYSKVEYINTETPVIIICKDHGEFIQTPNSHIQGRGCIECGKISSSDKQRLTIEEFITRGKTANGDVYDYTKTKYTSAHSKVIVTCKNHGDFEIDPFNHFKGYGCPTCNCAGISKAQQDWLNYIVNTTDHDIIYKGGKHNKEESFRFDGKLYRVDGYCKETKTIYEFLGCWYHGCPTCQDKELVHCWYKKTMQQLYQEFQDRKTTFENNGYKVISIWECEFRKRK
jgi:hypothetical protein